jgi:hypothetical protein
LAVELPGILSISTWIIAMEKEICRNFWSLESGIWKLEVGNWNLEVEYHNFSEYFPFHSRLSGISNKFER